MIRLLLAGRQPNVHRISRIFRTLLEIRQLGEKAAILTCCTGQDN